jgi:hypothetical protein
MHRPRTHIAYPLHRDADTGANNFHEVGTLADLPNGDRICNLNRGVNSNCKGKVYFARIGAPPPELPPERPGQHQPTDEGESQQ